MEKTKTIAIIASIAAVYFAYEYYIYRKNVATFKTNVASLPAGTTAVPLASIPTAFLS
jgi:hypothetical protein